MEPQRSEIDPHLPPLYRLVAVDAGTNAFGRARELAAGTAEDGTVVWSRRSDRLDGAVLFRPQAPLSEVLPVTYAVALGLGDAIGSLMPPIVALHFRWPDRLDVNGTFAGGLRAAWAEAPPVGEVAWLVVGVAVAITGPKGGTMPAAEQTTLQDEGCVEISSAGLLESFSRHALAWINRWQGDGFARLREAWLSRAAGLVGETVVDLGDRRVVGRFAGLDEEGGLLLETNGEMQTVPLADAWRRPSWRF